MKIIILHGELARRFGKEHHFNVRNVAEAIRALKANFKGFEQFLCKAHLSGMAFKVFTGPRSLSSVGAIHDPVGSVSVIRMVPVLTGAGAIGKFFLGVALVVAAIAIPGIGPMVGGGLLATGAGLALNGVASLLSKPPEKPKDAELNTSHIFNGPQNTSVQGAPVPIIYGERIITGSVVISAGMETHEIA